MKMIKKFGWMTALAALMASAIPQAAEADGDIRSIFSEDVEGQVTPSVTTPLSAGEKARFVIRLLNRKNTGDSYYQGSGYNTNRWMLLPTANAVAAGADVVKAMFPPKISLYMPGKSSVAAEIVEVNWSYEGADAIVLGDTYTDIVCEYVVQPGDFAWPLMLADSTGKQPATEGATYHLENSTYWQIVTADDASTKAELYFGADWDDDKSKFPTSEPPIEEKHDKDLTQAGLYIQTIDLDPAQWSDEGNQIWRTVYKGMTTTKPAAATIVVNGGVPETAVNVYVWTEDNNTVIVGEAAAYDVEMQVDKAGTTKTRKVYKATVPANETSVSFKLKGVAEGSTTLYLSATPTHVFNANTGDLMTNFVTRTVSCEPPPDPYVEVTFDSGLATLDKTVPTDVSTVIGTMTVALQGITELTKNVTVSLNPTMDSAAYDNDVSKYIALSETGAGSPWETTALPPATCTFTAGGALTKTYYIYARGAQKTKKGITFTPSTDDAATFKGAAIPATLYLTECTPTITLPDSMATTAKAGVAYSFALNIADSYNDLNSTEGYTVYVQREGLDDDFVTENDDGTAIAKYFPTGSDKIQITYPMAGTFTTRVYVVGPDGNKSNQQEFSVTVSASDSVKATVVSGATRTEGETITIKFSLSNIDKKYRNLYVYLKPANDDAAARVRGDVFTTSESSQGVLIPQGTTGDDDSYAEVTLLDGTEDGKNCKFTTVLCNSETYDETKIVTGYTMASVTLKIKNVKPTVNTVKLDSWTATKGQTVGTVSAGTTHKYAVTANTKLPGGEVIADLTNNFEMVWNFGDGTEETVIGNPAKTNATHKFSAPGTYTVSVKMRDKDMNDETTGGTGEYTDDWSFLVEVIEVARVRIDADGTLGSSLLESVVGSENACVPISLTMKATADLTVKLSLEAVNAGDPLPELNVTEVVIPAGKLVPDVQPFIKAMDGTPTTQYSGIKIKAEVTTATASSEPGKTWNELYGSDEKTLYIEDEAPTIEEPVETTNRIPASVYVPITDLWMTFKDVNADILGGLTVTIKAPENDSITFTLDTPDVENGDTVRTSLADQGKSIMFKSPGEKTVTIQVTDKDKKSSEIRNVFYRVESCKYVYLYPHGPDGTAVTDFSSIYLSAGGLGTGSVTADGTDRTSGSTYLFTYDVSKNSAIVTATGTAATDPAGYDSFFYCWINNIPGDDGEYTSTVLLNPSRSKSGSRPLALPTEAANADDENATVATYVDRHLEAFFSQELYPADNLGDMNADGVPDVYATKQWSAGRLFLIVSGAGSTTESTSADGSTTTTTEMSSDGSDLTSVASYNGDEDYIPAAFQQANPIHPTIPGWGVDLDFNARYETRGFHDGLNETGVSDWDLAEGEKHAMLADFALARAAATDATAFDATYATAEAWATATKWSCERRTDPTIADTDADGLTDGYEYFFWYFAKAGQVWNGTWERLSGSRFSLEHPERGDYITPEEIAEAFDPLSARPSLGLYAQDFDNDGLTDLEEFVLGTNPVDWDSNGDGASDYYAVINGIDPLMHVKTTITVGDFVLESDNPDHDFMAYCDYTNETFTVLTFADGEMFAIPSTAKLTYEPTNRFSVYSATVDKKTYYFDLKPVAYTLDEVDYLAKDTAAYEAVKLGEATYVGATTVLKAGSVITGITDPIPAPEEPGEGEGEGEGAAEDTRPAAALAKISFYNAETESDEALTEALPLFRYGANETDPLVPMTTNVTTYTTMPIDMQAVVRVDEKQTIVLIHYQVKAQFGFDPRVAWNIDSYGYVAARWHKDNSEKTGTEGETGKAVMTRAFTTTDEFKTLAYIKYVANTAVSNTATYATVKDLFLVNDLMANVPFSTEDEEGTNTVSKSSTVHGADSDSDGIPDGWELYANLNPLDNEDASNVDDDTDTLTAMAEFAGTDSCNAYDEVAGLSSSDTDSGTDSTALYPACDSIVSQHPGKNSGWFNKFFPTDPFNEDTDGDGVYDSEEGGARSASFPVGYNSYSASLTFIYGCDVADSELQTQYLADRETVCFRGGGLNPCAVDTDMDMLPDGWELQFAGIVFADGATSVSGISDLDLKRITVADGLIDAVGDSGYEIRGGMDGTFDGDAAYDFDHDGLMNFQEYLVQAMRHFRYDDSETPLMGLDPNTHKFVGFIPFLAWDGEKFYEKCRSAGFGGTSAWKFSDLGYFTRPPHDWDRVAQNTTGKSQCKAYEDYEGAGYRVMLPPGALVPTDTGMKRLFVHNLNTSYVSTDPRKWDTDMDGMDDYYEMFHGLNPILGSDADPYSLDQYGWSKINYDVIGTKFSGAVNTWLNAWTGWPMIPNKPAYDPIKYPWLMGTMEADPDGDGIRNEAEALHVNITDPKPTHTDPTPLWFTDSTSRYNASYVAQYYNPDPYIAETPDYMEGLSFPEYWYFPKWKYNTMMKAAAEDGSTFGWFYSFEENEGYDTDADFRADEAEGTKKVQNASDPQLFMDPSRRQALYLPGWDATTTNGSAAVSHGGKFRRSVSTAYDLLRQFTVECWVKPDGLSKNAVIIERVSNYGSSTKLNDTNVIRANFRLGTDGDGKVYGEFEGTTANSQSVRVTGGVLQEGEWTHIAFTYDGATASLYMNGEIQNRAEGLGLIPANGLYITQQDAESTQANGQAVTEFGYEALPCATIIGAHAAKGGALDVGQYTQWGSFDKTAFYKGWVDEVRIWDGARSSDEIASAYQTRYTFDDVTELRDAVYNSWLLGGTRGGLTGKTLPAELLQHYSFTALPGAPEPQYVITEPQGFEENVFDQVRKTNGDPMDDYLQVGWWSQCPVKSTVYGNTAVIPWIQNTVAHLPFMDGSCPDSQYWTEDFAGVIPAAEGGVTTFAYANTANPYPCYSFRFDRLNHLNRLAAIAATNETYKGVYNQYLFEIRSGFVGTSDLIPLGSAFAKRESSFWDGLGAMDAWEETKGTDGIADADGDGLPEWWRKYAEENYGLDPTLSATERASALVTYSTGVQMTAAEAYLRDLAKGMTLSGSIAVDSEMDVTTVDVDVDSLPDWWEKTFFTGIGQYTGGDDPDNDGLSNFMEYLTYEFFRNYAEFAGMSISPMAMRTFADDGQMSPDYFLKVGKLYLGEMFADHDFMEDWWEDLFPADYASRQVFDSQTDYDQDGWSNFAECRFAGWKALYQSDEIAQWLISSYQSASMEQETVCHPEPVIALTVNYRGKQPDMGGKGIRIRVSPDDLYQDDAIFTLVGGDGDKALDENGEEQVRSSTAGTGTSKGTDLAYYLGAYRSEAVMHGHLHPGHILPVSFKLQKAVLSSEDLYQWNWDWYDSHTLSHPSETHGTLATFKYYLQKYPNIELETSSPTWEDVGMAISDAEGHYGTIYCYGTNSSSTVVGEIDYRTGFFSMDPVKYAVCAESGELAGTVFRVLYEYRLGTEWPQTLYLSKPDNGAGYVREGKNYISACLLEDNTGAYVAGMPFGVATPAEVKVGWWNTPVNLELTDTSHTVPRFNVAEVYAGGTAFAAIEKLVDRGVHGSFFADYAPAYAFNTNMPATTSLRVRVMRAAANVNPLDTTQAAKGFNDADTSLDSCLYLEKRDTFSEFDLLKGGDLDLDWGKLGTLCQGSVAFANITNMAYRIALGDGDVSTFGNPDYPGNYLDYVFVNAFERGALGEQSVAKPVYPQGTVYAGQPTFKWTHTNSVNKDYPAFRLRVWKAEDDSLVYDSGAQRAPVRDDDGVYTWTAPIYADMITPQGVVFATTNNYRWAVSMLDAKFTEPNVREITEYFRLECSGSAGAFSDYGSIQVCVKYFGPLAKFSTAASELKDLIRVQAFATPDFSGVPAGEGYVTDVTGLSDAYGLTVNAVIRGLPTGGKGHPAQYYVRAFIDSDGDTAWSNWESWGYANYVNTEKKYMYNPKPFDLEAGTTTIPFATVYVEDQDTDQDNYPDAWEYETYGGLGNKSSASGPTFLTKVNTNLVSKLAAFTKLGLTTGTSAESQLPVFTIMSVLPTVENSLAGATLMGAVDAATETPETKTVVTIKSFSLETGIELEVETITGAVAENQAVYVGGNVTLTWKLLYSTDLTQWDEKTSGTITVDVNDKTSVTSAEMNAAVEKARADAPSGFFKVVISGIKAE